ncbi:unnamed protein product [Caenorhabditis auriculariae]|uniref:Fibronectin type-III domain-containing protein n=1 Tax=Caenorhabditis auriculariae TaxID=2777116 RepID=A0A8S1HFS4_9PELO|nr:unnamed protein product [Caenorhabditis auriculariae]
MSTWIQEPMEPIPEEDGEWSTDGRRTTRKREVYTSEQINTLVSTVPREAVPQEWIVENQVVDPAMAASYLTESLAGPTSARGSAYSYSYESHYDNPPEEEYEITTADGLQQTQKVTRVTKVTTTRSVRQIPVTSPYANIDFDSSGLPTPSPVVEIDGPMDALGIRLHGEDVEDRSAPPPAPSFGGRFSDNSPPGAPGVPDVIDVSIGEVTVVWSSPVQKMGEGDISGYQLQMRELPEGDWEDMGVDQLIKDTTCRVTNLSAQEVQFRVSAYGRNGFGPPSKPSLPVRVPYTDNELTGATSAGSPLAPGKPIVIAVDGHGAVIEWKPPVADIRAAPPSGYQVEYRVYGSRDWIVANEIFVTDTVFTVENLRPNGVYEFRVRGRNADGLGHPSLSSGPTAIRPAPPQRTTPSRPVSHNIQPPGQPQLVEADNDWVKLEWAPSAHDARYVVEYREIGDPTWHTANFEPIFHNGIQVEGLRRNSTYEFCAIAVVDGVASVPSETSDVIQLRPMGRASSIRNPPEMPQAPEYFEIDGDKITICWLPAHSSLPVLGYDVEFRDVQQDDRWYKVNDQPVFACKMTVGDLIIGHDYQFRVVAHNASGTSSPSHPSPFVHIQPPHDRSEVKYVEAERFGAVPLLQEEMVRESPPLPERDDSPPPLRRGPNNGNLQWRDPSLKEVIEYLSSSDKEKQRNATGYLQHLTFSDNLIKEETREYGGIPKLINLLKSDVPQIQKNACACLKNLCFGKENDANKIAVLEADGVRMLAALLQTTHDASVKDEATATLWNLSSADMLKPVILESATDVLAQQVLAPHATGFPSTNGQANNGSPPVADVWKHYNSTLFKNSTGVLRNISAASIAARQRLRKMPQLIEALVLYLTQAIQRNQVDSPTVENAVCLLRNLSYRIQEVVDPNYDPQTAHAQSAKSGKLTPVSPKPKKKDKKKEQKEPPTGASVLWQPHVVKLYLKLLQDTSNIDTLEASAGAIQNLAACQFPPSAEVRAAVRFEKGLPVLVELIRLPEDFVVCAVATALRNLSIDPRNRELIGKYALRELLEKLPEPDAPRPPISDQTIGAVLGILFEIVRSSAPYTRDVHELQGTNKLRALARSYPKYSHRVCKYASQVLYMMWQHKELHDGFKRNGLKEADFFSGTARRGDSSTLARPISSQGRERPAAAHTTLDDTGSSGGYGVVSQESRGVVQNNHSRQPTPQQRRYDQPPREPLYASVQKGNSPRTVDDSWSFQFVPFGRYFSFEAVTRKRGEFLIPKSQNRHFEVVMAWNVEFLGPSEGDDVVQCGYLGVTSAIVTAATCFLRFVCRGSIRSRTHDTAHPDRDTQTHHPAGPN